MAGTYCSNCGSAHDPDARFCASCGHALIDAGVAAAAPARSPQKKKVVYVPVGAPQRQQKKKTRGRRPKGLGFFGLLALGLIGVVVIANGSTDRSANSSLAALANGDAASGTRAGATQVTFEVDGDAPNGVDITYGNDTSNYKGSLPLYKTLTIDSAANYYDVSAQLTGGGNVSCSVTIGDASSSGDAAGGYNICSAQLNNIGGAWSH